MNILLILNLLATMVLTVKGTEYMKECDPEDECVYNGEGNGPECWGELYPDCEGRSQSPIALFNDGSVLDRSLKPLQLNNYDIPIKKADILNNGETVMITPTDKVVRSFVANGATFSLRQIHFHWGNGGNDGTEHSLGGRKFALEIHFVHATTDNRLAVLGLLCEEVKSNNHAFKPIIEVLHNVNSEGRESTLRSPIHLKDLVVKTSLPIYRYQGSLTTPPCSEGVIWSVSRGTIKIGVQQMAEFREIRGCEDEEISGNVRPLQPRNGRTVTRSYP